MVNTIKRITGFTLIELIVVIGIIAILSTVGLITYNSVQQDARNSRRKAELREMAANLEAYKIKYSYHYPSTCTSGAATCTLAQTKWRGTCPNYGPSAGVGYTDVDGGSVPAYIPGLAPEFMPRLFTDPRDLKSNTSSGNAGCASAAGANSNCYLYRSNGVDYKLLAHCTPEDTMTTDDPFYDPIRPTWAWQVHSSITSATW